MSEGIPPPPPWIIRIGLSPGYSHIWPLRIPGSLAHRNLPQEARLDAVEDLRQRFAGGGDSGVAEPDDRVGRVGRRSHDRGDTPVELLRPAREVDLRRLDPFHPRVYVENRSDLG